MQNIITISSKNNPATPTGGGSSSSANPAHLSSGAIAGIVIGCVLSATLIGAVLVLLIRRRNLVVTYTSREPEPDDVAMSGPVFNMNSSNFGSSIPTSSPTLRVLGGTSTGEQSSEADWHNSTGKASPESHDNQQRRHELHGESVAFRNSDTGTLVHELPGSSVPLSMTAADENARPLGGKDLDSVNG